MYKYFELIHCTPETNIKLEQLYNSISIVTLVAQMAKNPPAMQETWVLSLGWEDPLEKEMVTHSSILAW